MAAAPIKAQTETRLQDSLLRALKTRQDDTVRVKLLNRLAISYESGNQDTVKLIVASALSLADKLNYPAGKADALIQTSNYYRVKGDYGSALKACLQSVELYEQLKQEQQVATAYLLIAQIYKNISGHNQTDEYLNTGISYSRKAYQAYERLGDTAGMVNSLSMAGIIYRDKTKGTGRPEYYDSAFQAYTRALYFIEQKGKGVEYTGKLYNNISQVYTEHKKDYRTALGYLFRAVAFNKKENSIQSLSYNYGNISLAYQLMGKMDSSVYYAYQTLAMATALNKPERLQNAYSQLYSVYKATGNADSALHYYVLKDDINDSLTGLARTAQVVELQTRYETEKKESAIHHLQTEAREKNQRILLLGMALLFLGLLVIGMIWLYRRVTRQRRQISAQSLRLEVMMKELHHRVKNNLQIVSSLLSLQTHKLKDEEAIGVLKESQLRVQAMSLIHQRLYKKEELTAINMREYITDLASSLVAAYGYSPENFDLHVSVEKELMDIDKALPLGLILNEMITNSLKYAYAGAARPELAITLEDAGGQTFVRVRDNGIGIDEQVWKKNTSSFGKQLINALCRQLRAEQDISSHGGTLFTIIIPGKAA